MKTFPEYLMLTVGCFILIQLFLSVFRLTIQPTMRMRIFYGIFTIILSTIFYLSGV